MVVWFCFEVCLLCEWLVLLFCVGMGFGVVKFFLICRW